MNRPVVMISAIVAILAMALFLARRGTPFIYLCGIIAAIVFLYAFDWSPREPREKVPAQPRPKPKPQPKDLYSRKVLELSLSDARARAQPLIATTYDVLDGVPEPEHLSELGPALRELFSRYPQFKNRYGESGFGAVGIRTYDPPAKDVLQFGGEGGKSGRPYLRIGTDLDGNPILVQPMEDTVFVLRGPRSDPKRQYLASFPSIYHWLLIEHPDYNA